MRILFAAALLLSVPVGDRAQNKLGQSNAIGYPSQVSVLSRLKTQADEAHKTGNIDEEIDYRQQFTREEWAAFALDPHSVNEYDRYDVINDNDLPLGLLLEGTHRFPEAEATFRHNQAELAAERIAGNDIKSENELQLAHLLRSEGNDREANRICSHWKNKMRHIAPIQDGTHIYGIPVTPVFDTPTIEVARWDLACGNPDEGLRLVTEQIAAHPRMLASFTVLRDYYYAQGDFQSARKAESDGTSAVTGQ